jgi:hypothetical protein
MGKRERSYSTSSSSGSEHESSKRSRRDKGKSREKSSRGRHRLEKDEEINPKDDFYAKNKEFRHWLANRRKPRHFTKLDASDQKRYFKKFCKRYNKGKLEPIYYDGSLLGEPAPAAAIVPASLSISKDIGPSIGPARPSTLDDLAMQREAESDYRAQQKDAERLVSKRDQRESRQEERDGRATGRDRVMEKRAEKRESARAMANAREQGDMEFGDDVLMGGSSSSFQEAIKRRDASRHNQERQRKLAEKQAVLGEKKTEMQRKETDTMAMVSADKERISEIAELVRNSLKRWLQPSTVPDRRLTWDTFITYIITQSIRYSTCRRHEMHISNLYR